MYFGHSQAGGAGVGVGAGVGGAGAGGAGSAQAPIKGNAANIKIRPILPISANNFFFFMNKTPPLRFWSAKIYSTTSSLTPLVSENKSQKDSEAHQRFGSLSPFV